MQSERRREYTREYQRRYRALHPDRVRAKDRQRQSKNTENVRRRRALDPKPHRLALRKSFQKHKDRRMAEMREWRSNNRAVYSRHMRAAKAKRRAAEGDYKKSDIDRMMIEQAGVCVACVTDITDNYNVDHKKPLARGGTNWPDNLQLLCPTCNRSKGAKTMAEWAEWKTSMAI